MDSGSNSNGGQNNEHFEKSASNSAAKHVKFQKRSRRQLSLEIPGKLHVWFLGYKTRAGKISKPLLSVKNNNLKMNILEMSRDLRKHNYKQLANKLPETLPLNRMQTNFI